jgi:membrane-associated phospholipid phosphatase
MTYKDASPIYGIVAYTCATTVGFLRMYNNRHWFSDVVCGAGVGILASRLSFWAFDKIKQCLNKRNNKDLSFNGGLSPFVYQDKIGLSLSLSF